MIYITSDLHFCHDKEFLYTPRGFQSIEEMNQSIVQRWNAVITEDDDVYILGDLMLNDTDCGMDLLEDLNGRLHIVLGNHDTESRQDRYIYARNVVEICGYSTVIKYEKYHFYLSHYPTLTSNYDVDKPLKARVINLCGHSHTEDKFADMDKGLIYHCELDAHHCEPVLIDDIIWDIKNYELHQKACKLSPEALPNVDAFCRDCIDKLECPGPSMDGCPPGKDYKAPRCNKCVFNSWNCGDTDTYGKCKTYKRDPPDGGFYG